MAENPHPKNGERMPKPLGRRPIEIDLKKVEEYAQVCDNEEEIALALGISQDTLTRRKQNYAEFAAAIKRGKAKANVFVGGKLMDQIKNGNIAATIFYLKSRCGWKETQRLEGDLTTTAKPPEGLRDIYNALARGTKQ